MTGLELLLKPHGDRRLNDDEYLRIDSAALHFSYQLGKKLNLSEDNYIQFFRSSDGFLCFKVVDVALPDAFHINRNDGGTKRPKFSAFIKSMIIHYNIPPSSRYHITETLYDGVFKTSCRIQNGNQQSLSR